MDTQTKNRLETRLIQLIEGMVSGKEADIDFMIGLNRIDDILIGREQGQSITPDLIRFMGDYRFWLEDGVLSNTQKSRVGQLLNQLVEELLKNDDADSLKLAEEVKEWVKLFGGGAFRLTLRASEEEASLADRFFALINRETEEMNMLLSENDHLLTCLDDLLDSAENKPDKMYKHLAASLIYFLKQEGYKVDPYVKRLHQAGADV